MGVEVEIKVRVGDPERLRARLREIGTFRRSYSKADRYFGRQMDPAKTRFRLREDGGRYIVTVKRKELFGTVEQNQETEFEVSDGPAFIHFATELGFRTVVEKRKHGESWQVRDVIVELSEVNDLGYYVELEQLFPDGSDHESLSAARNHLQELLVYLGLDPGDIETRPYTQMIYENLSAVHHS